MTASSAQAIQVDLDLRRSVIDLGPTDILLAPVVLLEVVSGGSPLPLQQVHGTVTSVDVAGDRFELTVLDRGGVLPGQGRIPVLCDAGTLFDDGAGTVATGNVTARLGLHHIVAIDGSLTRNGIPPTR